ncbi:tyrosine-protein phosphatase non-receptor type 1-like isoform X1 [Hydra vulgaris]|uniref:protein-tyrosine-phosphatase n=1 Tax=Hydra vulgaris TaxID=6087 RepID=A0ABM4DQA0_HYDVU
MYLQDQIREIDRLKRWEPTFQMIQLDTISIAESKTQKVAKLAENRNLNRYRDVLPYDDSRIILKNSTNDYINANFVQVPDVNRTYILTQGPLPHTCESFWKMVWENNTEGIVMLNKLVEKNAVKCHPYWPTNEEESIKYGDYDICTLSESFETSYILREFLLTHLPSSSKRHIKQFHYMTWPDFGVPDDPLTFLKFLSHIKSTGVLFSNPVIHCSAGIGRSGTFCLVDAVLAIAKQKNAPDGLDPRALLLSMRKYRSGLIQTAEQYRFALVTIVSGLKQMFPQYFSENKNDIENCINDTPPPLPPRQHANKPPVKPERTSIYEENQTLPKKIQSFSDTDSSSEEESTEDMVDFANMYNEEVEEEFTELNHISDKSDYEDATVTNYNPLNKYVQNSNAFINENEKYKKVTENQELINRDDSVHKARKEQENENTNIRRREIQEKNIKTKKLVETIKNNMKKSEKQQYNKWWLCVGSFAGLCSVVIILYSWLS